MRSPKCISIDIYHLHVNRVGSEVNTSGDVYINSTLVCEDSLRSPKCICKDVYRLHGTYYMYRVRSEVNTSGRDVYRLDFGLCSGPKCICKDVYHLHYMELE